MKDIAEQILYWYARNGRKLPWRGSLDPYAVWISETMLQQTRVETVIPYYERWMRRFPSLADLAAASEQEVLSAWEGLGYYSRARNLHKAAKIVMQDYHGALPSDPSALCKLPGIGRYTAGAIASIAFGLDAAALDGNLKRVYTRLFDVSQPVDSPAGEKLLWELASDCLPKGRAGDFNQALMDLGSAICLPRRPACPVCPLREFCKAQAAGTQEQRPVLAPKPFVPHYIVTAAVLHRDGKVLLAKRPSSGLLGGMWEFPGGKIEPGETLEACLAREIREELGTQIRVGELLGVFKHAYTHFRITLHAFSCELTGGEPKALEAADLAWVAPVHLVDYPMGKVDRLIARQLVGK